MYVLYGGRYTRTGLVSMVLEFGNIAHELRELDMVNGEHRGDVYRAVNPAGYVPALMTPDGNVIHETLAIMLYLAERHRLARLVPGIDDAERGEFLAGLFFCSNDIQPEIKRFFFPVRYAPSQSAAPDIHYQARTMLLERFSVIEKRLTDARPFYLGERFSMVDLTIAFWASSVFPSDLMYAACPRVIAHWKRVIAHLPCAHHITAHHESSFDYWQNHLDFGAN